MHLRACVDGVDEIAIVVGRCGKGYVGQVAHAVVGHSRAGLPWRLGEEGAHSAAGGRQAASDHGRIVPRLFGDVTEGGGECHRGVCGAPIDARAFVELRTAYGRHFRNTRWQPHAQAEGCGIVRVAPRGARISGCGQPGNALRVRRLREGPIAAGRIALRGSHFLARAEAFADHRRQVLVDGVLRRQIGAGGVHENDMRVTGDAGN